MDKPIKILFLSANPKDTSQLRLDEEMRGIDQALRQAEFRDKFEIKQHWAVRVVDLQGYFLRHKANIVHFSGHGSASSEIILEDKDGNSQSVSTRALSQLFSVLKDNIRYVVLNACYSEQQAHAIAKHVDCVIGMSKAIGDKAAISFASAFYQALGYGRDVKTAFDLGCLQIDLESLDEQDTPKLLAINSDPQKIVFVSKNIKDLANSLNLFFTPIYGLSLIMQLIDKTYFFIENKLISLVVFLSFILILSFYFFDLRTRMIGLFRQIKKYGFTIFRKGVLISLSVILTFVVLSFSAFFFTKFSGAGLHFVMIASYKKETALKEAGRLNTILIKAGETSLKIKTYASKPPNPYYSILLDGAHFSKGSAKETFKRAWPILKNDIAKDPQIVSVYLLKPKEFTPISMAVGAN